MQMIIKYLNDDFFLLTLGTFISAVLPESESEKVFNEISLLTSSDHSSHIRLFGEKDGVLAKEL